GPGHGSVVTVPGGGDYFVYHAWPATPSGGNDTSKGRQVVLDRIVWDAAAGGPAISDGAPSTGLDPGAVLTVGSGAIVDRERRPGRVVRRRRAGVIDRHVLERGAPGGAGLDVDPVAGRVVDRHVIEQHVAEHAAVVALDLDALVAGIDHVDVADRDALGRVLVGAQPDGAEVLAAPVGAAGAHEGDVLDGRRHERVGMELAADGEPGVGERVVRDAVLDAVADAAVDRERSGAPRDLHRAVADHVVGVGVRVEIRR